MRREVKNYPNNHDAVRTRHYLNLLDMCDCYCHTPTYSQLRDAKPNIIISESSCGIRIGISHISNFWGRCSWVCVIITATHLFTSFTYGNQPQAAEAKVTSRLCMNMLVGQRQSLDFGPGEGGISLHFSDIENTILPRLETIGGSYSWIGRPMQANKKIICRKTERATTDLNISTDEKLSMRRIQWCGVKFYIFFFWRVILKK